MHALGIPTTRALAVVATGEPVRRETLLPGAVLARVAASHLRVGTFQYAAATGDADCCGAWPTTRSRATTRRRPRPRTRTSRCFEAVVDAQAALVARWMLVGFIHGVMNTDNMTISGETIDYGPCAFMDAYDPATVFSSIDHGGRYAYGNQPAIAQWNLARLAEALLPLIDPTTRSRRSRWRPRSSRRSRTAYRAAWSAGHARQARPARRSRRRGDEALVEDLLTLLQRGHVDCTSRSARSARPRAATPTRAPRPVPRPRGASPAGTAGGARSRPDPDVMDRVNPRVHPAQPPRRGGAHRGDRRRPGAVRAARWTPVTRPFDERPGLESYAAPAPPGFGAYVTYCGT